MAKGVIGRPFTFTALFLDANNDPTDVNTPLIQVFFYTDTGVRNDLVAAGTVLPKSVPTEVGRYAYTLTLPETLDASQQVYGVMSGVDPVALTDIVVEESVDLFAQDSTTGLRTSFIKDGVC